MIDYIKGIISELLDNYIVIENNFKGYIVYMSQSDIEQLEIMQEVKIYTRLIIREDSMTLYGFVNKDSRKLFDLLTSVTSVGPKASMGILSTLSASQIIVAILDENSKALTSSPGIGKKTADRIVLELKDKVSKYNFETRFDVKELKNSLKEEIDISPAVEALISLGYNKYEAKKALTGIDENFDVSKMIKEALKRLGR